MINNSKLATYFIFLFSIISCGNSNSTGGSEHKPAPSNSSIKTDIIPIEDNDQMGSDQQIQLIENKGIIFEYQLGNKTEFGEHHLIDISCTVINLSKIDVNYLGQSCNTLEYFLVFTSDSYEVRPLLNCDVTWPKISKLNSGDTLNFTSQILKLKNAKSEEKVGIDFRMVDTFLPFSTLKEQPEIIDHIYRAETQKENTIWSIKK